MMNDQDSTNLEPENLDISERGMNRNTTSALPENKNSGTDSQLPSTRRALSGLPYSFPDVIPIESGVVQTESNYQPSFFPKRDHPTSNTQTYSPNLDFDGGFSKYDSQNSQLDNPMQDLGHFADRIRTRSLLRRGAGPIGPLTSLLHKHPRSPDFHSEDILFLPLPVGQIPPKKRFKNTLAYESFHDKKDTNFGEKEQQDPAAAATEIPSERISTSSRESRREFRHLSQLASRNSKVRRPRGRPRAKNAKRSDYLTNADESESEIKSSKSEEEPGSIESSKLSGGQDTSTGAIDLRTHLIRCRETSYKYLTSYLSLCWNGTQERDDLIMGRPGDQLLQRCQRSIKNKAASILEGADGEAVLIFYQDPSRNTFINCPTRILPRKAFEDTLVSYNIQRRTVEVWEKVCQKASLETEAKNSDLSDSENPLSLSSENQISFEIEDRIFDDENEKSARRAIHLQKSILREDNMLVSYAQFNFTNPFWYYVFRSKITKNPCLRMINALPVSLKLQETFSNAEYVLMPHISEFMAPSKEAWALESGILFSALQNKRWNRPIAKLLLLIVIRISVSCYNHEDLLRIMSARILEFIWEVLIAGSFPLETPMNCKFINDSCTETSMRKAAWKAHLIPVQTVSNTRPAHFEDYLQSIVHAIQFEAIEEIEDEKKVFLRFKNEMINQIRPTLTSHNMALDIFIDLAKIIYPEDTRIGSINALRWARCFDSVINDSGMTWRNIKLLSVLHRGNYRVAERMTTVYKFGIPVLKLVLWALDGLVDEVMLSAAPHINITPEKLCDCLKLIGYMIHDEITYGIPIEEDGEGDEDSGRLKTRQFYKVLVDESVVHVLVRYVLIAPNVDQDQIYGVVYDHVWWILRKIGFVFPYQVNQLKSIALDSSVNIHVSGNAAIFVSVNWLRTNSPNIDLNERKTLVETLAMFSLTTESPNAKDLLSQLILDLSTA